MKETLRVLVVDDEEGMRRGVSRALARFTALLPDLDKEIDFATEAAESAEEALASIEARPPDLMLLDHKLPGMTGLDLLDRLEPRGLDTVIIMITAYASIETAIVATKRGAYDLLPKPFTPEDLKAAVRKGCRHLVLQREARRLAAERRQIRFQFLSVLAHELKSPLAAIEGYLDIMQDRALGGEVSAYAEPIQRSLVRLDGMRKLIFDLLDLTRIESGQKTREPADVDLVEVARAAIETVQPLAARRGIGVELLAPPALRLTADRGELEIILNNLVSNAVKYNRDGGSVSVRLEERAGGLLAVAVQDTGIGLTTAETARLFGEFVRIKNPKTRAIPGSGLGLSIVKRLAELYGGRVEVESAPDVGSTFTVTLSRESFAA
ncbi:MAG: sensor histidine kinase [Candidatus Krumholzibacteriia bacterium]